MARHTIEKLIDDLDGSEATRTVEFSYQGKTYALDLNDKNAAELEEALAPYIAAAGKAGTAQSGRGRGGGRRAAAQSPDGKPDYNAKDLRAWAEANGVDVPARGRIPGKVIEQFRAARA